MIPTRTLNDGRELPAIGFGTYKLNGDEGVDAMVGAIGAGYRLLDTALNYENEAELGEAVRRSGIPREDILITSKLPGRFHGFEETRAGFHESLRNLGVDYLDLFLIHWPLPRIGKYVESWRAMIGLRDEGLIRSIGVSNFTREHLDVIIGETGVVPTVNQIELHPHFPQGEMRAFHAEKGIQTESWTPLARQRSVLTDPIVTAVAGAHGVTPAQAVLRWHVELGSIPLPKASTGARQHENLGVFGFELTDAEVESISSLESGRLWGGDPETNEEF
ncbi:aldo/keto reductase [Terrimesophilobacter mesophilus]|uniref:Aldo/keto reductase n=1 Tax=Terrimesophilobacter mesophilus TaxID=433647 RepID=A0A4R8VEW1_9MICO|nr:aldo/keto reductase [Terrimesophilobacter mesophilus]TFB80720.1 aldo/keto reductase [Terrimesophilobacter mesophilus]